MKALLISDREEIINYVTPLLKEKGFDLIHYKWIIKALDNIEEIQPDLIVLSAMEYPRHWKTLAGFVQSGIGGNDVKMYLYDKQPLPSDEREKAYDLGVLPFEEDFKSRRSLEVELAISEPADGALKLCSGIFFPDEDYLELKNNDQADFDKLNNTFIKYITVYDGNAITAFSADAAKEDGKLCLNVKEYYEKKI